MAEFYGDPDFVSKLGNCLTVLGTEPADGWREVAPDIWEDRIWRPVGSHGGPGHRRRLQPGDHTGYAGRVSFPDPDDPARYAAYAEAVGDKDDRFVIANLGFSLYERAWTLCGMENLMMAMVADKRFVHDLLDRILAFNLRIIEHACAYDIEAMMFGDDWGMQTGLQMSPRAWREFIKPRIRQMYGLVKSKGKFVFIHSCGKVDAIFPDLIECGLDAFNPFQPEVMDVYAMKRTYGNHLTFFGGISTQKTLPYGTPAETRAEVRRLLDEIGHDGGYIASPAHAIPADARPENIAAMIDVLQNQA